MNTRNNNERPSIARRRPSSLAEAARRSLPVGAAVERKEAPPPPPPEAEAKITQCNLADYRSFYTLKNETDQATADEEAGKEAVNKQHVSDLIDLRIATSSNIALQRSVDQEGISDPISDNVPDLFRSYPNLNAQEWKRKLLASPTVKIREILRICKTMRAIFNLVKSPDLKPPQDYVFFLADVDNVKIPEEVRESLSNGVPPDVIAHATQMGNTYTEQIEEQFERVGGGRQKQGKRTRGRHVKYNNKKQTKNKRGGGRGGAG